MTIRNNYLILNCFIAIVWLVNGLLFKVFHLIPRHEDIVARILGNENASLYTILIGYAEILMAIWIIINFKSRFNAILQIIVILIMNLLEFYLVPDLLLWGKWNLLFAVLFSLIIFFNEFFLNKKSTSIFHFLKNHPFAIDAFFDSSLIITFAVPKEELEQTIPECLQLDTFQDKWAFIAVAMVQTSHLRPKGFPKCMGNEFFLIGYRIFVRYVNESGKRLRGLYILKSETNKKKMEYLGNIFTHYKYSTTDIHQSKNATFQTIKSLHSDFHITFDNTDADTTLPEHSPFTDLKNARRYAGPLPFTFTYDSTKKSVLIIEGVRTNWNPKPVKIINYHFDFLKKMNLKNVVLANAFEIQNVPYSWKKGKIETWN